MASMTLKNDARAEMIIIKSSHSTYFPAVKTEYYIFRTLKNMETANYKPNTI